MSDHRQNDIDRMLHESGLAGQIDAIKDRRKELTLRPAICRWCGRSVTIELQATCDPSSVVVKCWPCVVAAATLVELQKISALLARPWWKRFWGV